MRSVSLLRGLFFARQSASTEELREHSHTLAIAGAILDRLQEVNRRKNSVFVVVFLPTLRDYQRGIPSSVEALRQEARRAGILWIDLMPDFRRLSPAEAGSFFIQPGQTRYSLGEGHYNVAGNRFVTQGLYEHTEGDPRSRGKTQGRRWRTDASLEKSSGIRPPRRLSRGVRRSGR